ncbi:hypothetical protein [Burkholderia guangdongensis]|uniref:hypothetical protein n=1 Tax=Burkholderia guangdongensis TaxID=1792500 RepID=UPI0015C6F329|nr:hypothetical protein [Burkholderia guangdongensis]
MKPQGFHRSVTTAMQATAAIAPVAVRATMILAANGPALGAAVDVSAVLTCVILDTTGTNCHVFILREFPKRLLL